MPTAHIREMFEEITPTYDKLNFLLSFGLDRAWRNAVVSALGDSPHSGTVPKRKILDCCTGTGDLAILLARKSYDVTGIDFCAPMLEQARRKAPKGVSLQFIEGDITQIPFPDRTFHVVTNAFSLRNLPQMKDAFLETYRVLKPGGIALFLDLTRPASWLYPFHQLYLRFFVPIVGKLVSGNSEAYTYLCKSIQTFKTPQEVQSLLASCSFQNVSFRPLSFGISTLWSATK